MTRQQGARILIADDDPVFVEVATCSLARAGYAVISASDGAEAMEKLQANAVDAAIVDLVMPRIDGLRLIALIRATPELRKLPVLVITSEQDPSFQEEGMRVGATDFITKPVDWPSLPDRVGALIETQDADVIDQ